MKYINVILYTQFMQRFFENICWLQRKKQSFSLQCFLRDTGQHLWRDNLSKKMWGMVIFKATSVTLKEQVTFWNLVCIKWAWKWLFLNLRFFSLITVFGQRKINLFPLCSCQRFLLASACWHEQSYRVDVFWLVYQKKEQNPK